MQHAAITSQQRVCTDVLPALIERLQDQKHSIDVDLAMNVIRAINDTAYMADTNRAQAKKLIKQNHDLIGRVYG
jgi:hypothetical protein